MGNGESTLAAALRRWLMDCESVQGTGAFDVDYLGDGPGWALLTAPTAPGWRQNILGQSRPEAEQVQDFVLALRAHCGADVAGNLESLAALEGVLAWVARRSAAGELPAWPGGEVTAVEPRRFGGAVQRGAGSAVYRLGLRVRFRPGGGA